jgi:hypothetical protein
MECRREPQPDALAREFAWSFANAAGYDQHQLQVTALVGARLFLERDAEGMCKTGGLALRLNMGTGYY